MLGQLGGCVVAAFVMGFGVPQPVMGSGADQTSAEKPQPVRDDSPPSVEPGSAAACESSIAAESDDPGPLLTEILSVPGARQHIQSAPSVPPKSGSLRVRAIIGAEVVTLADSRRVQQIGIAREAGRTFTRDFPVSLDCGPNHRLKVQPGADGGLLVSAVGPAGSVDLAWVGTPWAVDAHGTELKTYYEIVGGTTIRQHVDATKAIAPVVYDPTYHTVYCTTYGYHADLRAEAYLDMYSPDVGFCPTHAFFWGRNNYMPIFAFETNVANEYGSVLVRQSGECSYISDTGPYWDFQVPCKAHDYCYDLRKAGFSGTVTDYDCDVLLFYLAEAHCNDRFFLEDCRKFRDALYFAVTREAVVTEPDPVAVQVWGPISGLCIDVYQASTTAGTPVVQHHCHGGFNQRFRMWPAPSNPGYFQAKSAHAVGMCLESNINTANIEQRDCNGSLAQQLWQVRPFSNWDEYSLRSKHHSLLGPVR